jgi:hypothetical protein
VDASRRATVEPLARDANVPVLYSPSMNGPRRSKRPHWLLVRQFRPRPSSSGGPTCVRPTAAWIGLAGPSIWRRHPAFLRPSSTWRWAAKGQGPWAPEKLLPGSGGPRHDWNPRGMVGRQSQLAADSAAIGSGTRPPPASPAGLSASRCGPAESPCQVARKPPPERRFSAEIGQNWREVGQIEPCFGALASKRQASRVRPARRGTSARPPVSKRQHAQAP